MRPLHVALLVAGAGIAGGLAVKMSQPPSIPVTAALIQPKSVQPKTPAVPAAPVVKPRPIPDAAPVASEAAAPAPVYTEPPKPAIRKNEPIPKARVKPAQPSRPAGNLTATLTEKPTEWIPGPYSGPSPEQAAPAQQAPVPTPIAPPAPIAAAPVPPAPVERQAATPEAAPIAPLPLPARRHVTLRTGTPVQVRLDESLSSDRSGAGDTFQASLAEPLVADGLVIAEKGARVTGRIVNAQKAGRLTGTSALELELSSIVTSDGQRVAISTDPWTKQGDVTHRDDVEKIGGGAALGAIIGAIAGGGKGAAIGAGVGGGAGAGTAIATRARAVNVPSETVIRFRLASRTTITEQQIAGR